MTAPASTFPAPDLPNPYAAGRPAARELRFGIASAWAVVGLAVAGSCAALTGVASADPADGFQSPADDGSPFTSTSPSTDPDYYMDFLQDEPQLSPVLDASTAAAASVATVPTAETLVAFGTVEPAATSAASSSVAVLPYNSLPAPAVEVAATRPAPSTPTSSSATGSVAYVDTTTPYDGSRSPRQIVRYGRSDDGIVTISARSPQPGSFDQVGVDYTRYSDAEGPDPKLRLGVQQVSYDGKTVSDAQEPVFGPVGTRLRPRDSQAYAPAGGFGNGTTTSCVRGVVETVPPTTPIYSDPVCNDPAQDRADRLSREASPVLGSEATRRGLLVQQLRTALHQPGY